MELQIQSVTDSSAQGVLKASDVVFSQDYNQDLVHRLVVAHAAAARQGTKAQKNRAARSGGGVKPFRQKGTGRARAGTIRSPLWRGGGIHFAAGNRDFTQKMNKKMQRKANQIILAQLVREERFIVMDKAISLDSPKTKSFVQAMGERELDGLLILVDEISKNLDLSTRNLPGVCVMLASRVDPRSLVRSKTVLVTAEAVKQLEERFA